MKTTAVMKKGGTDAEYITPGYKGRQEGKKDGRNGALRGCVACMNTGKYVGNCVVRLIQGWSLSPDRDTYW